VKKTAMKGPGRPGEEKPWDTILRHQLSTSFVKEPDIHTLLFVSGPEISSILRMALRDYMEKYQHPARTQSFRQKVFLEASSAMAGGASPRFSQLPSSGAVANDKHVHIEPATSPPQKVKTWSVATQPAAPELSSHPSPAHAPTESAKLVVNLDFGTPEPLLSTLNSVETPRPNQRDKWLARHKGTSA
jgi:hypothetical protein